MTLANGAQPSIQKTPQYVKSLASLPDQYSLILLDVVGVLHDGKLPLPQSIQSFKNLLKTRKIILLSNNPRPGIKTQEKLHKMGFPKGFDVFTSGDATRYYIDQKFPIKKIYHLGQHKNTDLLFDKEDQLVTDIKEADIVILSLFTEEGEDDQKYISLLKEISKTSLPVICSNPDITAPFGQTTRKTAGHYTKILEDLGKEVTYMGKPHPFIYELIWQKYKLTNHDKNKSIMIGDTIETDITGANKFGIESLLVLTGNTAKKIPKESSISSYLEVLENGQRPTYYSDHF